MSDEGIDNGKCKIKQMTIWEYRKRPGHRDRTARYEGCFWHMIEHGWPTYEAMMYAEESLGDPELRELYEDLETETGMIPFVHALYDFYTFPQFEWVNVKEYHGRTGDPITIWVRDMEWADSVKVTIHDGNKRKLEEGEANPPTQPEGRGWTYTATRELETSECTVLITITGPKGDTTQITINVDLSREPGWFIRP